MNPIFQAMLKAALFQKVACPSCKRSQVVSAQKKKAGTRCKYCGSGIPPSSP
ncbi:MAG: hypothetical protein HPY50_10420 [Firmicutes bacterium]|nr:hypothetical protein [Bacillota bacterium]